MAFSSAQYSSHIDFVLATGMDRRACLDCKVIPSESIVAQHTLMVANLRFQAPVLWDKSVKTTRTGWWKLEGEARLSFSGRDGGGRTSR